MLDLKTGESKDLFKADFTGRSEVMAAAKDGKVALVRLEKEGQSTKAAFVEIFNTSEDCNKIGALQLPACKDTRLNFRPDGSQILCDYKFLSNGEPQLEAWPPWPPSGIGPELPTARWLHTNPRTDQCLTLAPPFTNNSTDMVQSRSTIDFLNPILGQSGNTFRRQ